MPDFGGIFLTSTRNCHLFNSTTAENISGEEWIGWARSRFLSELVPILRPFVLPRFPEGRLMSWKLCCPHCSSTKVRSSRWRWRDLGLSLLCLRPSRCRGCNGRFYVPLWRRMGRGKSSRRATPVVASSGSAPKNGSTTSGPSIFDCRVGVKDGTGVPSVPS